MRRYWPILLSLAVICLFQACMPAPFFQKQEAIPQNEWSYSFKPSFTFDITDTAAIYEPYFLIRHSQAYPYCNLWMIVSVKGPGDAAPRRERVDITLAAATGKWLGRGMGELFEQRMKIVFSDSIRFHKPGSYTVSMEQNMRINPLPEIMNVGFCLKKKG